MISRMDSKSTSSKTEKLFRVKLGQAIKIKNDGFEKGLTKDVIYHVSDDFIDEFGNYSIMLPNNRGKEIAISGYYLQSWRYSKEYFEFLK